MFCHKGGAVRHCQESSKQFPFLLLPTWDGKLPYSNKELALGGYFSFSLVCLIILALKTALKYIYLAAQVMLLQPLKFTITFQCP